MKEIFDALDKALPAILWVSLGVLVLYSIISILAGRRVVVTSLWDGKKKIIDADQYYFLPAVYLTLKATARVTVTKSQADGIIRKAELAELLIEAIPTSQPDTNHLFVLNYKPFLFANDELRMATNTSGLIENVSSITEDRLPQVIEALSATPQSIAAGGRAMMLRTISETSFENEVTQTVEYKREFIIRWDEIEQKKFKREWFINVDGIASNRDTTVNASLAGEFTGIGKAFEFKTTDEHLGILTRPLHNVGLKIKRQDASGAGAGEPVHYGLLIPDHSKVICVPIKRFPFVRNQYIPKFSSGLLIENFISKPSEFEGFLSIPINIFKAILSIPSALFNFKITNLRQQEALRKEMELATKPDAAIKPEAAPPNPDKPGGSSASPFPGLGKAPAAPASPGLKAIEEYIRPEFFKGEEKAIPTPPTSIVDRHIRIKEPWPAYRNDRGVNDCVPASAAHLIMCWTVNAGTLRAPSEASVLANYTLFTGYDPDTGANKEKTVITKDFLTSWQMFGMSGDQVLDFIRIQEKKEDQLKTAVHLFGGCLVGLQLPDSAQDQAIWGEGASTKSNDPNPNNGHAVAVLGYDPTYLYCISWGRYRKMTWNFYTTYNDESYAVLSDQDWLNAQGLDPDGIDLATLKQDLSTLG